MKIVGVIVEYNPFHQGHAWHLAEARAQTGADYVLVAMSGNFVQRGAPAMFDKYIRAEAALRGGADLVLELPPAVSTASAESFASGAVSLLMDTGIVTDLCFGCECGDLEALRRPAEILAQEPEAYRTLLRGHLRQGISFPLARAYALHEYDPDIPQELLREPNNLLGLEYLKALTRSESAIRPHAIRRTGASYHEKELGDAERYASASAIRGELIRTGGRFTPELLRQLPASGLYRNYEGKTPVTEDAFSLLLIEKLRRIQGTPLDAYLGVTPELARRIESHLDEFVSFSQFTDLMKTRDLTRTAVSRALLHILLDIRESRPAELLRVLGFRRDAQELPGLLKEHGKLPLLVNGTGQMLPTDWLYADRMYETVRALLQETPYREETRRKMLVV